jgi:hypothetical protein
MERDDFLALRAVHAVQVSTEPLAEVVRAYNPVVKVIPNQIAELPPFEPKPEREEIRIFFGAQNRENDWAIIMPAIWRIADEMGDRIRFVVVHDQKFYDALGMARKTFCPFMPYHEYRATIRSCDIALLPLEDTPSNRCKSDLKFLECAAEGVAVLASGSVYSRSIATASHAVRGEQVRVEGLDWTMPCCGACYSCPDEFEQKLGLLIERPAEREYLARSAYAYVRDHRLLGQHYKDAYDWYRELLTRKPELDRSLHERVPGLAPAPA